MSTTEKQVTLDQLQPGDILVMQGAQNVSWVKIIAEEDMDAALIQAIMWLTDSDVCHGAIYYGDQNKLHNLIDDGEKGVGQHGMTHESGQGDKWYVRRMKQDVTMQPVLGLAMKYKNLPTAYDWNLLTMLGLLLIYKKITPNTDFYQVLLLLLEKIVVTLNQLTHKKKIDYFVCSQFVAACFDQAGSAYELHVKNGSLSSEVNSGGLSVLDHCISHVSLHGVSAHIQSPIQTTALTVKDIQNAVQRNDDGQTTELSAAVNDQLTVACDQFLQLFFAINGTGLGLTADAYNSTTKRLEQAQKYQADFVTPADLKSHCTNLEPLGMIQFVYGKAMP